MGNVRLKFARARREYVGKMGFPVIFTQDLIAMSIGLNLVLILIFGI